jgi:hypothetical protein
MRFFMLRTMALVVLSLLVLVIPAAGAEFHVSKLDTAAPAGALSPEIAAQLQPVGWKVTEGDSRVVCELWLAQAWPLAADATTGPELLYPLTPGQLIGAIRFPRKTTDFREQEVSAGLYTLRYGQQPVDGAHVGTSATRDFLLLLPAAKDRSPQPLDYKSLTVTSKEATGGAHPGILSLQKAAEGGEAVAVRHDADHDWTIVRLTGVAQQGGAAKNLPLELVIIGKAGE